MGGRVLAFLTDQSIIDEKGEVVGRWTTLLPHRLKRR
jgi:hypothetical protein